MPVQDKETRLITPYGGELVNLLVDGSTGQGVLSHYRDLPRIPIPLRAQYDLELLAVGAFSPLDRFMGKRDYQRVLTEMRLENGTLFPIPVTLPVDENLLVGGIEQVTLTDPHGLPLAVMGIEEVYRYDPQREAHLVLGTSDECHPLIAEMEGWDKVYISGPLQVINLPKHCENGNLCLTPTQTRVCLERMGNARVVAFQTRNPMHRIHEELTKRAAQAIRGSLLIQPVVGLTKPGDIDQRTRIQIYQVLVKNYYDPSCTLLSLLPLAMRLAGPREALWHAIIRRNYGATHLIVGRDHAGPGKDGRGKPFFGPYEAQLMIEQYADEIGVQPLEYRELVYLADENLYIEAEEVQPGARVYSISGTQVREEYLAKGRKLPEWFTRPEVAEILQRSHFV